MSLKGRVGAVYLFDTAPDYLEDMPRDARQIGGFFCWDVDVNQNMIRTFGETEPELHCVVTGWTVRATAFWGNNEFFHNAGELAFIKLFLGAGGDQRCLWGYVILPASLQGDVDALNEAELYIEGLGELRIGN